jgi:hypothetical protein
LTALLTFFHSFNSFAVSLSEFTKWSYLCHPRRSLKNKAMAKDNEEVEKDAVEGQTDEQTNDQEVLKEG